MIIDGSCDPAALSAVDRYRLLINSIVPRPIAWVTSQNTDGLVNLAPFSFFNGVTASPPIVQICIAHREPLKDTLSNIRATGEVVIHLVPGGQLAAMHASGAEYPSTISEVDVLGLLHRPAERVRGRVLVDAEIAFECRLVQEIPEGSPHTQLCLFEIIYVHVSPQIAQADGLPDPHLLRAVGRLGGSSYLTTQEWQLTDLDRVKRPP